jgi:phosphoserine phosphatase
MPRCARARGKGRPVTAPREREIEPGLFARGFSPPLRLADFRLVAFDMDSTLISIECVDEVADVVGRRAEVAAITEATMRGEIGDYKHSLRRRLALLRDVPVAALEEVVTRRLRLNPGVETFVRACQEGGLKTLLVSGGFTYFSERVRAQLGLDFARANMLEIVDGRLTGLLLERPWGEIVDGAEKKRVLLEVCELMGIPPAQAIAVGDGANDLPMMSVAGLSIAYHSKPAVRDRAMLSITEGGMDRALRIFSA